MSGETELEASRRRVRELISLGARTAEKHRAELAAAHERGRQRERDFARKQANSALHALLSALDAASGPRAHRVGCDCAAAECVRLRFVIDEAKRGLR